MIPTRDIVHNIQELISSDGVWAVQKLAELAEAYAQAANDVSERAYRIRFLVEQNQVEEAKGLAAEDPAIRDEVACIEFDGKYEWLELCEAGGLATPTSYDPDTITDIISRLDQTGYAAEDTQEIPTAILVEDWPQPEHARADHHTEHVQRLLKTYRRMSLGQAPAADRLKILRQLRETDPRRDFWNEDIRTFERERIDELARLAKSADRKDDLRALETVLAMLDSDEWIDKPTAYVASVERLILPRRRKFAAERYTEILAGLREAHSLMDQEGARQLIAQWEAVDLNTGVAPEPDALTEMKPVQEWLSELEEAQAREDEFLDACTRLAAATSTAKDLKALESSVATVLMAGRGIPEELARSVSLKRAELQQASKRKQVLLAVVIIAAAVLIALGANAAISHNTWKTKHLSWQRRISDALDKGDIDSAGELLANCEATDPDIYRTPEIQTRQSEYRRMADEDNERIARFNRAKGKLEELLRDPTSDITKLERTSVELDRNAKTEKEKASVQECLAKIETRREADQEQLAKDSRESLQQATRLRVEADNETGGLKKQFESIYSTGRDMQLDEYEASIGQYNGERQMTIASVRKCLDGVERIADEGRLLPEHKEQVDNIRGSIDKKITEAQASGRKLQSVLNDIRAITEAGTRLKELATKLTNFAKAHPDHPLAGDFARAATMATQWESVKAWALIRSPWLSVRMANGESAQGRLKQVEDYLKGHQLSLLGDDVIAYKDYLKTAEKALPKKGYEHHSRLALRLSDPLIAKVFEVKTKGSRRYYSPEDKVNPVTVEGVIKGWNFKAFMDLAGKIKVINLPVKEFEPESPQDPKIPMAPQALFAERSFKALKQFQGPGWETFFLERARDLQACTDIDPILRVDLLHKIVGYAADTTPFHTDKIKGILEGLDDMRAFINWMNPDDDDANIKRPQYEIFLTTMDSFATVIENIEGEMAHLDKSLAAYREVGVMLGPSEITLIGGLRDNTPLYIVSGADKKHATLVKIGTTQKGKAVIEGPEAAAGLSGSPVFIKTK